MFNETLRIERIARTQGGRYYCKAENGVGVPAIKSIRVDVQCESGPPLPGSGVQAGKEDGGGGAVEKRHPCRGQKRLSLFHAREGISAVPPMCTTHTTHTFPSVIPYEPCNIPVKWSGRAGQIRSHPFHR